MKMDLNLKGAREIDAALKEMAKSTAVRTARQAMRNSLSPVEAAAKALAPVGPTGNLRDSVTISHKLTPSQAAGAPRDGKDVQHMYVGASAPPCASGGIRHRAAVPQEREICGRNAPEPLDAACLG